MFLAYQNLLAQLLPNHVAMIAFNRPGSANALNMQMALELADAFTTIANDGASLRAVILTGQGKHFCAGADLKERKDMDEAAWHQQHATFENAVHAVTECPVPVIAAINGAAYGGGLELALACDFIFASPSARFAMSETSLGIIPGMGGTQQLPRRIGSARAKELIFAALPFSAEEATQWGLVNRLCPSESLLATSLEIAQKIAQNAPLAVRAAKSAINKGNALSIDDALALELRYYNSLLPTKDRHEGINAFNQKRKPVFRGE